MRNLITIWPLALKNLLEDIWKVVWCKKHCILLYLDGISFKKTLFFCESYHNVLEAILANYAFILIELRPNFVDSFHDFVINLFVDFLIWSNRILLVWILIWILIYFRLFKLLFCLKIGVVFIIFHDLWLVFILLRLLFFLLVIFVLIVFHNLRKNSSNLLIK